MTPSEKPASLSAEALARAEKAFDAIKTGETASLRREEKRRPSVDVLFSHSEAGFSEADCADGDAGADDDRAAAPDDGWRTRQGLSRYADRRDIEFVLHEVERVEAERLRAKAEAEKAAAAAAAQEAAAEAAAREELEAAEAVPLKKERRGGSQLRGAEAKSSSEGKSSGRRRSAVAV